MPNATAAQKPAPTPIAGAQSRNAPELRSKIPIMTAKVTEAHTGDAHDDDPGGTSSMMPKRRGSTVMTTNIKTVPFTIGVTTRLRRDNRMESAIFDKPETLTNAASVEGPPSTSITTTHAQFSKVRGENRFTEAKATRLSTVWVDSHNMLLKVSFLRTDVVILAR